MKELLAIIWVMTLRYLIVGPVDGWRGITTWKTGIFLPGNLKHDMLRADFIWRLLATIQVIVPSHN
jgi:hypothetical protein